MIRSGKNLLKRLELISFRSGVHFKGEEEDEKNRQYYLQPLIFVVLAQMVSPALL